MDKTTKKPLVSIILPIYNEEENILELYRRLTLVLRQLSIQQRGNNDSYEIIMVNDGSTDSSWQLIKDLHSRDLNIKGVCFSKNFGHHAALTAGLDHAKGQINIIMDADLQAQPEDIPKAVAKIKEGYNIVWAVSPKRQDSFIINLGSKIFYWLMNHIASIKLPENIVFMCFDELAANAIRSFKEKKQLPSGIWSEIGFKRGIITVEKKERQYGVVKYNFFKRSRVLVKGVISYSKFPLFFVTILGLCLSCVSFMVGIYMLYLKFFIGIPISGYASIIVSITMLSGVQLIALGIIALYISIVFDEVKGRPIYIVEEILE